MIKKSKVLFGLFTGLAVVAPIATVVSCGSAALSRYDTKNDGTITIATTWSDGGTQWRALEAIINEYNAKITKYPGIKKVKMVHYEGGYGDVSSGLIGKEFKNRVKEGVPNIIIDYPAGAGTIAAGYMSLNIAGPNVDKKNRLDRKIFDQQFVSINDKIGGIKAGGMYSAPLAFSGEMSSLDGPLMRKIFTDINANGGTVTFDATKSPKLNKILNKTAETDWSKDINFLTTSSDSSWSKVADSSAFNGLTVNADTFKSYEGLFEFSSKVAKFYGILPTHEAGNVVGIDAPTNLFYGLAFSKAKTSYKDFIFTKKDFIEWNFLEGSGYKNSPQYKIARSSLAMIEKAVRSGSTWLGGGGTYGSSDQVAHNMPISIGSTAGWTHTYTGDTSYVYAKGQLTEALAKELNNPDSKYKSVKAGETFRNLSTIILKSVLGTKAAPRTKSPIAGVIAGIKNGSHINLVYANGYKGKVGKYNVKLMSKVDAITMKHIKNAEGYISTSDAAQFVKGAVVISAEVKEGSRTKKQAAYWVPKAGVTTRSAEKTIQKSEAVHIPAPMWANKADITNGVKPFMIKQGPSFITVHANKTEDNGTASFIKWFFTEKAKLPFGKGRSAETTTAIKYFDAKSYYITPLNGWKTETDFKYGNKLLGDAYLANKDVQIFESPVDDYTSGFRKSADSAIRNIFTSTHSKATQTDATNLTVLLVLRKFLKSHRLL